MLRILDPTQYALLCWYPKPINRILSGTENECFKTFRLVIPVFYQPKIKTKDTREEQKADVKVERAENNVNSVRTTIFKIIDT